MWTTSSIPQRAVDFHPNHFVYLADTQQADAVQINSTLVSDETDETTTDVSSLHISHEHEDTSVNEENINVQVSAPATEDLEFDSQSVSIPDAVTPLPTSEGLSTDAVLSLLRCRPASVPVLRSIPKGSKNNVYCVIQRNISADRHHHQFDDDCGVWDTKNSNYNMYPYLECDGRLRRIHRVAVT